MPFERPSGNQRPRTLQSRYGTHADKSPFARVFKAQGAGARHMGLVATSVLVHGAAAGRTW